MQMNISIDTDLKNYIDHQYSSGNYREAIIQAMHCLTDVIRNISGNMLDGEKLVQKAFEGSSPLIKLSKLISETDKDIQRGFTFILKGTYAFIRNPRHHETFTDVKIEADQIIIMINYLLTYLKNRYQSFNKSDLVKMIIDDNFDCSDDYIDLLIERVPMGKRLITVQEFNDLSFSTKDKYTQMKFICFIRRVITTLDKESIDSIYGFYSERLELANGNEVLYVLNQLSSEHIDKISKLGLKRVGNMIKYSFELTGMFEGKYSVFQDLNNDVFKAMPKYIEVLDLMYDIYLENSIKVDYNILSKFFIDESVLEQPKFNLVIEKAFKNNDKNVIDYIKNKVKIKFSKIYDYILSLLNIDDL